ncbi:hypothetical protein MMC13_002740 [Lambiella insularis]|nr:hypothetical protein [Lambiella insularis]
MSHSRGTRALKKSYKQQAPGHVITHHSNILPPPSTSNLPFLTTVLTTTMPTPRPILLASAQRTTLRLAPFMHRQHFASANFDQTKKGNDPTQELQANHKVQAQETTSDKRDKAHPAQQPDPQKEPSRSTGIEKEGPDGARAGRGKE